MLLRMQFSLFFFQSLLSVFRLTMSKKNPQKRYREVYCNLVSGGVEKRET